MSGGVDSSVAAYLLKEKGYDVVGLFMNTGARKLGAALGGASCVAGDAEDAARVAGFLGIPFQIIDLEKEFGKVIDYFVDEYNCGRTPNPCIVCNRDIKFGVLWQRAREMGAEYIATGHHARVVQSKGGSFTLKKGCDKKKDQSYVLFALDRKSLKKILLPVGGMTKDRVRSIAAKIGLHVKNKPESQDVCFAPDGDYRSILSLRQAGRQKAGNIVDEAGKVLGAHDGYQHFTVGQRRGIGVAAGVPIYVIEIRPDANEVVVGPTTSLFRRALFAENVNWLVEPEPEAKARRLVSCAIRYGHHPQRARIQKAGKRWLVTFNENVRAVAPGQAAVFYDGEVVMGGGWISSTFPQ
jgi:tRNA-specific 2-thiouridylase